MRQTSQSVKDTHKTPMAARTNQRATTNSATVGYEAELWKMADALRGSMDAFEKPYRKLEAECRQGASIQPFLSTATKSFPQ